jgi:hypothetical protein
MRKTFICIALFYNFLCANAQVTYQQAYWTRLIGKVKINDKWSWQIQADNRRLFGENTQPQLQFITHANLYRKLTKNTEGALGFTFSEVWQGNLPVLELRPFQEFYFYQKLTNKWLLSHRLRTEQRWFHNYGKDAFGVETLTSGYNFKFRFRYMSRLEYKWNEKWTLKTNAELMYHQDDFDQYRYYGGVEYKILKDLSIEMGYLKVYQKRANNKGYYDRDNLRMTLSKDFVVQTKK